MARFPKHWGNLSNLTILRLNSNELDGEIPVELGNLSNLTELRLYSNQLVGEIPKELSNLSNLTYLDLGDNQLVGEIPKELSNLSNLTVLGLNRNQLGGQIPTELGNLSNLIALTLHSNQLSGRVPAELGKLSNLVGLTLEDNASLTGALPQSLSGLTKLAQFQFHNTGLCAPLDAAFQTWLQGIEETNGSNCGAGLSVCDRTRAVRDGIMAQVSVSACGDVTGEHLSVINSLNLNDANLTELKAGIFPV